VDKTPAGLLGDGNGGSGGKARGNKIAVDPANSNIIHLASLNLGLMKTVDGGNTWARVSAVPASLTDGLSFVVIDKGSGTTGGATNIIYVGVVSMAAQSGVWKSTDAGATWVQMTGSPNYPWRADVDPSGTLFVTQPGTTNGGVWKVARGSNSLTNVSPTTTQPLGCGPLAVDPVNANTLYVQKQDDDFTYRLPLFQSHDGGASWSSVNNGVISNFPATQPSNDQLQALGCMAINPLNPKEAWCGANGTLQTPDITNQAQTWTTMYKGHEETLPYNGKSLPDGTLLCGYLDFPGTRHTDVSQYPASGFVPSSNPISSGSGPLLDCCHSNPLVWARVVRGFGFGQLGYSSNDGGAAWTGFATEPPADEGGRIAVSGGDARNFVWLGNTGNIYFTRDGGAT